MPPTQLFPLLPLLAAAALAALPNTVSAQFEFGAGQASAFTYYQYQSGNVITFLPQAPRAPVDNRMDPHLLKAAHIAAAHALPHSRLRCWQYVKNALLEAGAVGAYPATNYASQAGEELAGRYGFVRLAIHDPYLAPVGAVLVYRDGGGAGHVELRTERGFASDYHSPWRCKYKLIGVYAKFSA